MQPSESYSPFGRSAVRGCIEHPRPEPMHTQQFESAKNEASLDVRDRLQHLLYAFLETEPVVAAFQPICNGVVEVRYRGGTVLAAAFPSHGAARTAAIRAEVAHSDVGRRLLLVPERRLTRWPYRDNRALVADCGHAFLRPSERAGIVEALLEQGGSAALGDLASCITGSIDPIASLLSLVSKRVVAVDMSRPIDGNTTMRLFDPLAAER